MELKRLYLDKYAEDKKLANYFEETAKYIKNSLDLFNKMKNNTALKKELLDYYEANKNNLAFKIIK